jgi:hypothetical protein
VAVSSTKSSTYTDPVVRLSIYWLRAKLMHDLVHTILDANDRDLGKIEKEGGDLEFMTFLYHWLSGLFVVVEGFNKLRLRDARVQALFKEHLRHLKAMRHETYHFSLGPSPDAIEMFGSGRLNWAEELHEAIGLFLTQVVKRKALAERIMELRTQTRPRKK